MRNLHVATRGIASWRERLANPERQWKRRFSAFETAVAWELAAVRYSGLPETIENLFHDGGHRDPKLLLAVAEYKVELPGGAAASQSDIWAIVQSAKGTLSMTVEAKAAEPFGDEALDQWLVAGKTESSRANREARWEQIARHLPAASSYGMVRYQLLHRCASAVIEAKRFGFPHAAFVVQAFDSPESSFMDYKQFCDCIGIPASRGCMASTSAAGVTLWMGWADCPFADDEMVARVAAI